MYNEWPPVAQKAYLCSSYVISLRDQRVSSRGEESARGSLFPVVTYGSAMSILIHSGETPALFSRLYNCASRTLHQFSANMTVSIALQGCSQVHDRVSCKV